MRLHHLGLAALLGSAALLPQAVSAAALAPEPALAAGGLVHGAQYYQGRGYGYDEDTDDRRDEWRRRRWREERYRREQAAREYYGRNRGYYRRDDDDD